MDIDEKEVYRQFIRLFYITFYHIVYQCISSGNTLIDYMIEGEPQYLGTLCGRNSQEKLLGRCTYPMLFKH